MRVNVSKTETMVCAKEREQLVVKDCHDQALKQVGTFKYLGTVIVDSGGCEEAVKARIKVAWAKWKELSGVMCDKRMPIRLKAKVYKSVIRTTMLYGAETWTLRRTEESALERTEMRMLRWICGVTLRDRLRNDEIRRRTGVPCITEKAREARLRWFGHVWRKDDDCYLKRIMNAEVYGQRSRGRQKKRWRDAVSQDLKTLRLKEEDAMDRDYWRRMIRVADP